MPGIYDELAADIAAWLAGQVRAAGKDGVVIGLSGGVDSAVCAALAAAGLGPGAVLALHMPCGSSPEDAEDARRAADAAGIRLRTVSLDRTFRSIVEDCGLQDAGRLTLANIRPRLRMTVLYAFSEGRLVVGTGNLSESLVGYSTKWGDSAADLAPLADLYKDEVLGLAGALGVPEGIIGKPPSAGLWPGQTDEGEMGFTYGEIRAWSEGLPTAPASAEAIRAMHAASMHKRRPVPHFDAGEWFGAHGKARSRQLS